MDLKALIAKMDQIESKQLLNEGFPTVADAKARADKEKTTGKFDKKEIKPGVTQYTRKSSTFDDGGKDSDQKKAEKKKKNEGIDFQSSIAQMLLKEFGLEERVGVPAVANPYQGADAEKFAAMSPADQAFLTKGGGKPDINDEFILARAPNKGKVGAAPSRVAPAPAAAPSAAPTSALPAGMTQAQVDQAKNAEEPDAVASTPPTPASPTSGGDTGEVPGVTTQSGATPAAPAKPAAPKRAPDPKVMAMQQELIKKGAKIKADGIMGPQTQAAMKQFGSASGQAAQPAASPTSGGDTGEVPGVTTQSGATPAAPAAAGKPRYKTPQEYDKEIARFSKTSNPSLAPNAKYIATLQAEKAALEKNTATSALVNQIPTTQSAPAGQAAQPAKTFAQDAAARKAAANPGALGSGGFTGNTNADGTPMTLDQINAAKAALRKGNATDQSTLQRNSVRNEDDAILERIRTALFR